MSEEQAPTKKAAQKAPVAPEDRLFSFPVNKTIKDHRNHLYNFVANVPRKLPLHVQDIATGEGIQIVE